MRLNLNLRSVRVRTTIGAAVALWVLLVAAGLTVDWLVARQVRQAADAALVEQAQDRAQLLANGNDPQVLVTVTGDEVVAVIVSPSGQILAYFGTPSPEDLVSLPVGISQLDVALYEHGQAHHERITAAVVINSDGSKIIVGNEGEQAAQTIQDVRTILLSTGPLVAAIGAVVAWTVTGRALAPVHQLRHDLDGVIGLSDRSRVAEPNTGDEVQALARTTNDLLDRLEQQSVARRRFVADASHELKSPIANAKTLLETTSARGAQLESVHQNVVGELDRLQDLVDDLLFLARTDETSPTQPTTFDLDDVLFDEAERAAIRTHHRIDGAGIQPAQVTADRSEVARAVRNLVENAARHAHQCVTIAVEPGAEEWVVVIADDGPGIPPDDRDRIFERFARLDHNRSRSDGGTGLGLSIVSSIAARNNGNITIADSQGSGARFELRLPCPRPEGP